MATGFYYLAAAPPASAAVDVCGPGNFSSACAPATSASPQSAAPVPDPVPTSPASLRDSIPSEPVVESPATIVEPTASPSVVESPAPIVEPVAPVPAFASPAATSDPVPLLVEPDQPPVISNQIVPVPPPIPPASPPSPPAPNFPNIYTNAPALRTTTIPEPGTVIALLLTGVGIICSGRKRNKQVGQQR